MQLARMMATTTNAKAVALASPLASLLGNKETGVRTEFTWSKVDTPLGPLTLATSNDSLKVASFDNLWDGNLQQLDVGNVAANALMREAKVQVEEYFAGVRKEFTIALAPEGTTFQKKAWAALGEISYGETVSYSQQALSMGEAGKARAVGAANAKNPICVFIPCHRVIAKGGGLCGYGFGLPSKQYLLDLESGGARNF